MLGSHNSWSYLPIKQWWIRPFRFIAKCQEVDIEEQYNKYNVRCFDLRVRFTDSNDIIVCHGLAEFNITYNQLLEHLEWIDNKKDCYLRVIHEARNEKQYTKKNIRKFQNFCKALEYRFKNIKLWCGKNLYNWETDYFFTNNPTCLELYSSVVFPNIPYPKGYAKYHNAANKNLYKLSTYDILLMDYINL